MMYCLLNFLRTCFEEWYSITWIVNITYLIDADQIYLFNVYASNVVIGVARSGKLTLLETRHSCQVTRYNCIYMGSSSKIRVNAVINFPDIYTGENIVQRYSVRLSMFVSIIPTRSIASELVRARIGCSHAISDVICWLSRVHSQKLKWLSPLICSGSY